MHVAAEPSWHALKDEELLSLRICDLGVRIEQSELEAPIGQLYNELAARGVSLRPDCYLGDEWFSPEGVPAIAIPFYLAHPDEDFAETFAVWLATPPDVWRQRYRGWKAIEKLEYVNILMNEAAGRPPTVTGGRRISEARKLRKTLAHYYAARRKLYAED